MHITGFGWQSPYSRALALQGQVFAVAMHSGIIKLYDPKNYTAGPFNTFTVSTPAPQATCSDDNTACTC